MPATRSDLLARRIAAVLQTRSAACAIRDTLDHRAQGASAWTGSIGETPSRERPDTAPAPRVTASPRRRPALADEISALIRHRYRSA